MLHFVLAQKQQQQQQQQQQQRGNQQSFWSKNLGRILLCSP